MNENQTVTVHGHPLRCHHCRHDGFSSHRISVEHDNERFLDAFKKQQRYARVYACNRCGFSHWFYGLGEGGHQAGTTSGHAAEIPPAPEPREAPDVVDCLSCGKTIAADAKKCAACGWSWDAPEGDE